MTLTPLGAAIAAIGCPAAVLAILHGIIRVRRVRELRRAGDEDQALAIANPELPAHALSPRAAGAAAAGPRGRWPNTPFRARAEEERPGPGTGPPLTHAEEEQLAKIGRERVAAAPLAIENSRRVADGLRLRFPHISDSDLGAMCLETASTLIAAWRGAPTPEWALRCVYDAYGLAAEELTRFTRQETPR